MRDTQRALIRFLIVGAALGAISSTAWARGASPYLPLNLSPEMERQIERVLILGEKPVSARPIAAATVLDALPAACRVDEVLCRNVREFLARYRHKIGIAHASVEGAAVDGVAPTANRYGMLSDSAWQASAQAYWQPNDHIVLSVGGVAYEDGEVPTGTLLSMGWDVAQLDVGWREHWFSPFTDSAMIISTQAKTLPSITLSNYRPLTSLGFQYELFVAEMEHSDRIVYQSGFTSGRPRLAGVRFTIEPVAGWSLSANRMTQFGGGAYGGNSLGDIFDAVQPGQADTTNQVAAWTSRFIFPGSTPFAAYLEYAGEDNSYATDYRLGNSALSIGLTFPRLWKRFDLTYEASEWQNGWYQHTIYLDGLTNDGHVLGHWGADNRAPGDGVGAQTHMLRIGWEAPFGGLMQLRARTIANESYGIVAYERGYDVTLGYSRAIAGQTFGAEVMAGRDVFGDSFGRVAGYVRLGAEWAGGSAGYWADDTRRPPGADLFVDAGVNVSKVQIRINDGRPTTNTSTEAAPHIAIGARRAVSTHVDLGVRAELDEIDGELLLAVRALDYRYRFNSPLALSFFLGAARYDLATPAYGYYIGGGLQWRNIFRNMDLGVDLRYADKVARDKLLPEDPPQTPREDAFYDISSATLSLSYRF